MSTLLPVVDGAALTRRAQLEADVVVVGTGPGGSAAGREIARSGAKVLFLEEGPHVTPSRFPEDGFGAMAILYRDLGAQVALGRSPTAIVQGKAVGGTSVVNGAISWRLPEDVRRQWVEADPGLEGTLDAATLEALFDAIERELSIAPTDPAIAGPNNLLLAKGAEALGLEHRAIRRNVSGCEGLGRCLQGCPKGHKQSMERTLLPDAVRHGAQIWSGIRARRVLVERHRAVGVEATSTSGIPVTVRARHAVVLAASAVQTPLLLLASGLGHGPVGERFMCHPGVSVAGEFDDDVRLWRGATQGHEVVGLRRGGIKFEALGYDMALVAGRLTGVGRELGRALDRMAKQAHWGAAIRAEALGTVRPGLTRPRIRWSLVLGDVQKIRRGVSVLGQMFFAAGARAVFPGVAGMPPRIDDPRVMQRFDDEGPLDPRAYTMAATHLFGTCRMGSDARTSVVDPRFRHHRVSGLFVADSSVFPSNTGVNPQTSILSLATLCGRSVVEAA